MRAEGHPSLFSEPMISVCFNGTIYAQTIYSSMGTQDNGDEQNKMVQDYWDAQSNEQTETLRTTAKYQIQKMYVQRLGNDYLYLSASLDNGDRILIRSSIDSMERSVKSVQPVLSVYLSVYAGGPAAVVVYIISRSFTQPILTLAQIATRLAQLDFSTKYRVNRQDEIGVLGNSMNYLSSTLETTLGELKLANAKLKKDLEKQTQIDNMRTEFLSNVSHELKTPIALIQGYAEGLMENINDDEESRNFYCEVIVDEAAKNEQHCEEAS